MAGQIRVDEITDEAGTGSPSFPNGVAAGQLTGNVAAARITNALNASGDAPIYACRAWVNFNGTTSPGTIRASGNVSSVTKNGTGDYTVNFTTAMPDVNYSANLLSSSNIGGAATNGFWIFEILSTGSSFARTTNSFRLGTLNNGLGFTDSFSINVSIFR